MRTNQKTRRNRNVTFIAGVVALQPADPRADSAPESDEPPPSNDNATRVGELDTTKLLAAPDVVRYTQATLRRYGVTPQDMPDAVASVQVDAIEAARTKRMPADRAEWKALAVTIAARWAIDRLREAEVRAKYDAGLCEDPDLYMSPTLHWEQRDPVDTKRYLAILKDLFDSGQMPEDGAEILWGEAEDVPHDELAAELGISETKVKNRLFRMRAKFHARLAALGMLVLMLLMLGVMLSPVGEVAAPAPEPQPPPVEPAPEDRCAPVWDSGTPISRNPSSTVRRNCALLD